MSDTVIQVENLAKRYILAHQGAQGVIRYHRFSDVLMNAAKAPLRALKKREESTPEREEFWALRDVSFDIKRGEVVGIIGRNGAGKSTLLKILSRITEPTAGRIEIEGRVASLLEVGTGFHPELTGRENIYLNGAILGMARVEIKSKFDEIVAFAEVEKFLDTPVRFYSSGMYVRLAFAVAAHLEPEILIVDEVLAVGDAQFQKKCLGKMQDVSTREGRTVLFVSHNMETIQRLCERVVLLDQGRVSQIGEPQKIINQYFRTAPNQDATYELSGRRRDGFLGRVQIRSVRLENSLASNWMIPSGESIGFVFALEAKQAVGAIFFGIGLFAANSTEIISSLSSHDGEIQLLDAGDYLLTYRFKDLFLVPGQYSFSMSIRSEQGVEDYIPEAFFFDVTSSPHSAQAQLDGLGGFVVPAVQVKVERV